jgi:hypothetical protein
VAIFMVAMYWGRFSGRRSDLFSHKTAVRSLFQTGRPLAAYFEVEYLVGRASG